MNKTSNEIMQLEKLYASSLEKCCGKELSLPPFTFCGNDTVTITIVSAEFAGLFINLLLIFNIYRTPLLKLTRNHLQHTK